MKTADKTITNAVVTALLVAAVVTTGCDESDSSVVQAMRFYRTEVILPDAMVAVKNGKVTHVPLPGTGH